MKKQFTKFLLLFLVSTTAVAQNVNLKGKITDVKGAALVGVGVQIKGTKQATVISNFFTISFFMKFILSMLLVFGSFNIVFGQTTSSEIAQQVTNWHIGLEKADLDGLVAQYASDAVFFPTFINSARTADERKVFLQTLIAKKPVATLNNDQRIRIFGNIFTCSGTWVFDVNAADGSREKKPVRYLFVFEKRAGKWLIIEQHVSAFPVK
jgi:hypothetical protein